MLKPFITYSLLCGILVLLPFALGKPQDFQTAVLMAAGQVKEAIDNGAATRFDKSVEVLGAKFKNNVAAGFGDAMKQKREIASGSATGESLDDSYSESSYEDYSEYYVDDDVEGEKA
ncbi:uncharacterized protein LOC106082068 [Stomoxys calcitrans]|uniref:Uncharacterized protein n=1 Tax=Stomoxys calcitrans TaxID=35570 RepID=A0A1I8PEM0_STOCA|nr:uncharacterized protein LOC106082068 [Stomoxys calcitrans]